MSDLGRVVLRKITPFWAYQLGSRTLDYLSLARSAGVMKSLQVIRQNTRQSSPVRLHLRGLEHALTFRPATTDLESVVNVVCRSLYRPALARPNVVNIVDAGANIGDSTVWFLNRFPNARVIAVEPEDSNFDLLMANTERYGGRVIHLKAGLWSSPGTLELSGGRLDGIRVSETTSGECQAITMGQLVAVYGFIDILKMDIEGAELEVLGPSSGSWLDSVGLILTELHSKRIADTVIPQLCDAGFQHSVYREVHIFKRPSA